MSGTSSCVEVDGRVDDAIHNCQCPFYWLRLHGVGRLLLREGPERFDAVLQVLSTGRSRLELSSVRSPFVRFCRADWIPLLTYRVSSLNLRRWLRVIFSGCRTQRTEDGTVEFAMHAV